MWWSAVPAGSGVVAPEQPERPEQLEQPVPPVGRPTAAALVLGEGMLARAVAEALGEPVAGSPVPALVLATDCWDTAAEPVVRGIAREQGLRWLSVRAELSRVVIGPMEVGGQVGCGHCAHLRRGRADEHATELDALRRRHAGPLGTRAPTLLTKLAADTVAALVADELERSAQDPHSARTHHGLLLVNLEDLRVSHHRFLPDPLCGVCGDLPEDTAEAARIALTCRSKLAPRTYRVRRIIDDVEELVDTYVDARTGLIRKIHQDTMGGLVLAGAMMPIRSHPGAVEPGIGRTRSYRSSRMVAVLEAMERYGGVGPGGRRTVVSGSFAELSDHALDPRTLGVHPQQSYQDPDFYYRQFDVDQRCRWVWGYSFARQEPILVPETVAYYHVHSASGDARPFLFEISNGCALGSCLEEAILYGILETAERDAFLMTWYRRIPAPQVDLSTAVDRNIPLVAAMIAAETGYQARIFDTTMEQGIPSVWAMAVDPQHSRPDRPAMVCAAGSNLDPEQAVLNALSELGPILVDLIRRYPQEAERSRAMVQEPDLVLSMQDHSTLYGAAAAYDRVGFLGAEPVDLANMRTAVGDSFSRDDLTEDLREVLRRYSETGLDVIVIDQSTPEHRAAGLACVKTVIPGTVPMTFGYRNRRIDGLARLRSGLTGPLNPHPHPFP
jgi:ribosomal protein S12 methylthiotransferase accessory factor